MMKQLAQFTHERLAEWVFTSIMILVGMEILIWPTTLKNSAFLYMPGAGLPTFVGCIYLTVGVVRAAALLANGRSWVYGPRMRAYGALASAVIWGQMCLSLIVLAPERGVPSIGIPNWFVLTCAEMIIAYKAATNVRST